MPGVPSWTTNGMSDSGKMKGSASAIKRREAGEWWALKCPPEHARRTTDAPPIEGPLGSARVDPARVDLSGRPL